MRQRGCRQDSPLVFVESPYRKALRALSVSTMKQKCEMSWNGESLDKRGPVERLLLST